MPTKKLVDTSFEERGRKGTPAPTGALFSIAAADGKRREAGAGGSRHRGTRSTAHARNPPRKTRGRNSITVHQREVWPRCFRTPRFSDAPRTGKTYLMTISHHASPPPLPRRWPAAAAPAPTAPGRQPPPPKGVSAPNIEPTLRGPNFPRQRGARPRREASTHLHRRGRSRRQTLQGGHRPARPAPPRSAGAPAAALPPGHVTHPAAELALAAGRSS